PASDPHVASPCAAGQQVSSRPLAQHPVPAARLTAQGAVALLAAVAAQNEENRQAVLRAAGSLGKLPAEDYVHEELAWRLEA
ncbi:DNA alkylation repair enzyme, partial [Alistipes onderdonkii]